MSRGWGGIGAQCDPGSDRDAPKAPNAILSFLRQYQLGQVQRVATLHHRCQPPLSPSVGTPLRTLWVSSKTRAGKSLDSPVISSYIELRDDLVF